MKLFYQFYFKRKFYFKVHYLKDLNNKIVFFIHYYFINNYFYLKFFFLYLIPIFISINLITII